MSPITSPRSRSSSGRSRFVPPLLAVLVPVLFFFLLPPLAKSGLWDPYELNVADLARRVALNLHGASSLALSGADNSLPHLNDLGRPQLPFTSIALGFKFFGLHEWAGRAPLALWGLLGVLATYGFVARLVDRRAGVYAAVALTTMPLYFTQARIMLGDIVAMAAYAFSFGGLAVAVFDGPRKSSARVRALWLLIALVGLASGYESRGVLLGVASPLLAIGLAWGVGWAARVRRAEVIGDVVGALALFVGALLAVGAIASLSDVAAGTKSADLDMWVGAIVKPPTKYPTFDFYIGHLAEALAPWSAFVPLRHGTHVRFAAGERRGDVPAREPRAGGAARRRRRALHPPRVPGVQDRGPHRLHRAGGARRGPAPSPCAITSAAPTAAWRWPSGRWCSSASSTTTSTSCRRRSTRCTACSCRPSRRPSRTSRCCSGRSSSSASRLSPFSPGSSATARGSRSIRRATGTWCAACATRGTASSRSATSPMVAGASVAGLLVWLGAKTHAKWLPTLSQQVRDGILNSWWLTAFIPIVVIFGLFFATDVWLWAFGRARQLGLSSLTRGFEPFEELFGRLTKSGSATGPGRKPIDPEERLTAWLIVMPLMYLAIPAIVFVGVTRIAHTGTSVIAAAAFALPSGVAAFLGLGILGDVLRGSRAAGMAAFATVVGFILCFSYFPALANQLSPKEVFESYQKVARSGEQLALFGVGSRTAAYYIGGQPQEIRSSQEAFQWLMTPDANGARRYLAMKTEELGRLNSLYRELPEHLNLPVLDARSSQIMLAASTLNPGEKNENPFAKMILSAPPVPQHAIDVNLEDKLEIIGFDILDERGFVQAISPGKKYRMRTYYKVLAPITTEWESFIHIDGYKRRHNGDHKLLDGKYPMALWQAGDLLADEYEFTLEPNFSPGNYTLYFGLFLGDSRMKVKTGPQDGENRINGGPIRVL